MFKKMIGITMMMLAVGVLTVKAAECTPIIDNSTNNSRTIKCDIEKPTVTTFDYPKNLGAEVIFFDNSYCRVTCKESIAFSVNSIRRVYSGTGFEYPLYMSARRICQSEYKEYKKFDEKYRELVEIYMVLRGQALNGVPKADIDKDGYKDIDDYTYVRNLAGSYQDYYGSYVLDLPPRNSVLDGNAENTVYNSISKMRADKAACNGWGTVGNPGSKYQLSPNAQLKIETSGTPAIENYIYEEIDVPTPVVDYNMSNYLSCSVVETMVSGRRELTCKNEDTIIGWNETASVSGRYTMKPRKLELYTGVVMLDEKPTTEKTCKAGEKFFIGMGEKTKPDGKDPNDMGYPLTLTVKNIGNNLDSSANKFDLTVNCWYQVKNIIKPGTQDALRLKYYGKIDKKSKEDLALVYRTIDLNNPFPGRNPRGNWEGYEVKMVNGKEVKVPLSEKYITNTANTIRNETLYKINLNRQRIGEIKRYNSRENYGKFILDKSENSNFINTHSTTISRGK